MSIKTTIFKILYTLNKRAYYQLRYWLARKRFANLKRPSNLSEFLLSEMLKPEFKNFAPLADKIAVRDYIASKGLSHLLPAMYGEWDDANAVNFEALPEKFAMKTNHGCGNHIICHNKQTLDINKAKSELNKTLKQTYNIMEPHYQYIKPRIFAEELINDGKGELPIDYKFMCVNGQPMCILACSDRGENDKPFKTTFSPEWNHLPWVTNVGNESNVSRPKHLEEMVEIAKTLSADFKFVRVDLYDCPDKVVFGELTFSPAEGILSTFTLEALQIMNPLKN